ncbi:AAA family ATPase [Nocardiopsis suaedae]|uniref:ATP-binding protein n=1 Tax=Nocardiopsis suaedae TaxID=3018444 RepID=A0ABT4TF68_9ACTN|nr:ATP-binding protein [Nocardiopsis suaedae]MDA2803362.1 ATP-binding protein [Nocardiopsis suaedae]
MLLSFRVANHRSLREEQQLLLVPADREDADEGGVPEPLPVAGLFGPNASGKSNVLDALGFMRRLVRSSMEMGEPGSGIARDPFALSPRCREEPSHYAVDLLIERVHHTYGFTIDDEGVAEEWLYWSLDDGRPTALFEREGDHFTFHPSLPETVRQVQEITDVNTLFLTVAARTRLEIARPVYNWFASHCRHWRSRGGREQDRRDLLRRIAEPGVLTRLQELIRAADTGIESVELEFEQLAFDFDVPERPARDPWDSNVPRMQQQSASRRRKKKVAEEEAALLFHHRTGGEESQPLTIDQQSDGTWVLLALGVEVLDVLRKGSLLVVDELDSHLHPHLSAKIIDMFKDRGVNERGAQLVFSSHDTALLGWIRGGEVLDRDEAWFVEKDKEGATRLYSLSDFRDEGENPALAYLTGRYGAIPEVAGGPVAAPVHPPEEQDGPEKDGPGQGLFE